MLLLTYRIAGIHCKSFNSANSVIWNALAKFRRGWSRVMVCHHPSRDLKENYTLKTKHLIWNSLYNKFLLYSRLIWNHINTLSLVP